MNNYNIYGIGTALVDTEVMVTEPFLATNKVSKGIMTLVDEPRQSRLLLALKSHSCHIKRNCGGSACNTVVATNNFGTKAFYSAKVADDSDGDFFIKDLNAAGVAFHSVKADVGVTGKCLVMVTPDADRTMNTYLGVSVNIGIEDLNFPVLACSGWLYIEGYMVTDCARTEVALAAMQFAKKHGVKTSLSLSDPFVVKIFLQRMCRVIDDGLSLLFCNLDEVRSFTKTRTLAAAAQALKSVAKIFVITCGADGSLTSDGRQMIHTPGLATRVIDTNGAGDMFAGAFLYAISCGHDYAWAAGFANAAASRMVSQFSTRFEVMEYKRLKQSFNP